MYNNKIEFFLIYKSMSIIMKLKENVIWYHVDAYNYCYPQTQTNWQQNVLNGASHLKMENKLHPNYGWNGFQMDENF